MKRIAPDVERLMWLVAEERDPRAVADFEARFPELRYELSKRISMVSDLKSAAKKTPPHEIPRFVPRSGVAMPRPANRSIYVAVAFVATALAFGLYAAKSMINQKPPELPAVPVVNVEPPKNSDQPLFAKPDPDKVTGAQPNTVPPTTYPNVTAEDNPLLRPITFHNVHAPLEAALAQVCKQAGLSYQIAPGMPQVEVELNYEGEAAGDVLADLGRRYHFTPYPQERASLLFIPVRPDGEQENPAPKTPPAVPPGETPAKNGDEPLRKNLGADGR